MIDWLTMCARLTHSERIFSGRTLVIDQDGALIFERERGVQIEGSHDTRVLVWSHRQYPNYFQVSGNPAKFLQGHNIFGSNDVRGLALAMLESVVSKMGIDVPEADRRDWLRGNIGLSCVDITESWQLASRAQVRSALQALEQYARLRNRGRGSLTRESTLYWGKHSRRWALKAYAKGDEIMAKKHRLPDELMMRQDVEEFADCLLRFELRLLGLELAHRHLSTVGKWKPGQVEQLHREAMEKLEISDAAFICSDVLEGLSPRLNLAYQAWRQGQDLRQTLPRRTFYRYRAELLEHGVDIAMVRPREESNVVPLRVVLHAYPVSIPDWARKTPLYFEPRPLQLAA